MEEQYQENIDDHCYSLALKEDVVKSDFINMVNPFVNANSNSFDESFDIWVKAATESEESAWSITINGDYSVSDRDVLG